MIEETGKCSLCDGKYDHHGNNPAPLSDGRCCDRCQWLFVIPARNGVKFKRGDARALARIFSVYDDAEVSKMLNGMAYYARLRLACS